MSAVDTIRSLTALSALLWSGLITAQEVTERVVDGAGRPAIIEQRPMYCVQLGLSYMPKAK
jgi:hypothetical protein